MEVEFDCLWAWSVQGFVSKTMGSSTLYVDADGSRMMVHSIPFSALLIAAGLLLLVAVVAIIIIRKRG